MKALSHRKLKKIYGHVSVGIMKRKGCCGVALRDCSSRTPIEIANHDNTGIGFVASSVAAHRRGRRHKHRPWEECDFTTKPITSVPAQTVTTLASTTTPHAPFCVTTPAHNSTNLHTGGCAFEHGNDRLALQQ